MRKYLTLITLLCLAGAASAQKMEVSTFMNGGLFSYSGSGIANQSYVSYVGAGPRYGTSNRFGGAQTLSYGIGGQLKLISKNHFIAGLQGSYDILRSSMSINNLSVPIIDDGAPHVLATDAISSSVYAPYQNASGTTHTVNQYINLHPFIGYRLKSGLYTIDLMPGIDIAFATSSKETGSVTTNYQTPATAKSFDVNNKLEKPAPDLRLRMGVEVGTGKWALMASYAKGRYNFLEHANYTDAGDAYSSLWRLGLSYRIK